MDLLDNIAMELQFEFHLYVVRDQLFGSKQKRDVKDYLNSNAQHSNSGSGSNSNTSKQPTTSDHDANDETSNS